MHTHTHTCIYTEIYHMYEYHHMKQGTLHVAEHEDISSHTQYMYSHTTPEKHLLKCMYKEIYHMCIYRHVQRETLQVAGHGEISAHSQRHTHIHTHTHTRTHTRTYLFNEMYHMCVPPCAARNAAGRRTRIHQHPFPMPRPAALRRHFALCLF